MRIYYEGKDITDAVQVAGCVVKDYSGGKTDSLNLVLEQAQEWYSWGPKSGDRIQIVQDRYRSGEMYLAAVYPEGNKFRIAATSAKPGVFRKANMSYERYTLRDLLRSAAAESDMGYGTYGMDEGVLYPFLMRQAEGIGAFLDRIATWEGAKLKCWDGKFLMIDIEKAQGLEAVETIALTAKQPGVIYRRRDREKLLSLQLSCAFASGSATDKSVGISGLTELCNAPATDLVTANRWAKGMLLGRNRKLESLEIESRLHPLWTAMCRVDVTGETDATGKWLCDEVEHDFVNRTSKAKFLRCVETIG